MSAGWQKYSTRTTNRLPRASKVLNEKWPGLDQAVAAAKSVGEPKAIEAATKALGTNRVLQFNNRLDAVVTAVFSR